MGKQTFEGIKKILGIFLLVIFVASITAASVSAVTDTSKFGPISKQNYNEGYDNGYYDGHTAGMQSGSGSCNSNDSCVITHSYGYKQVMTHK
jgi:hypothetical protein